MVVVIVVGAGIWWAVSQQPAATQVNITTGDNTQASSTDQTGQSGQGGTAGGSASVGVGATVGTGVPTQASIVFTDSGFSPKSVTIAKGGAVTFVDQSGRGMWVASDAHPTHTQFDGTSRSQHCTSGYAGQAPFDQCAVGSSYSFTFNKAGSFGFHNHAAAQFAGTVIVQ